MKTKITWAVWCNEGRSGGYGYEGFKTAAAAYRRANRELRNPSFGVTSVSVHKVEEHARYRVRRKK